MKQLAIIGSTASGKSDLALALAKTYNGIILSIDSLSIYKKIDIASAKPSQNERNEVIHFGIDVLSPESNANVFTFIDEYHRALEYAKQHNKNLIIVGGSSFYLKSMLEGLSPIPDITDDTRHKAAELLLDIQAAHTFLAKVDPETMTKIHPTDRYRIEKMLLLFFQSETPPSEWFRLHPPSPVIRECPVLDLNIERNLLRNRIALRTQKMVASGLIDEVAELERNFGRLPNSMKAIGIVETFEFLDGKISKKTLIDKIATHTAQLAKRQQTFNLHQFSLDASGSSDHLEKISDTLLQ
ncbi:MAG: tRNA (adenosine(37)-N6)-dimethylallyltransferase MiaA [Sulfuricurvum sp.]|jgi:tRNA dimethylallyltransferase|uniref:tRNA (adenosine(37)-N6)-dimethylallyltransferase MiaA n=1 Tax=Sulfuricurvum sp. TaxID=2025608 RepID=UPI0026008A74|nr:tRNA (adenosine(37)-N6)-dimethylallyltransferase MiaA [Sulfuricurvum sp.]MCK9371726.1 tRNA (adenosine(37)-N6)-dimethylallyltransferase MiaA [Sulfuricurvum sp.]